MAIHKIKLSPRQKMINLMYVVLMAMLALNVSSDVLQGFSLVDQMLNRKVATSTSENEFLLSDLKEAMEKNPQAAGEWYGKAQKVKEQSDELYNYLEELKNTIDRQIDELERIAGLDRETARNMILEKLKSSISSYSF